METTVRKIIGKNTKTIRETLGLSQIKFALVTGISRASIVNIESGKNGYNVNLLDSILSFSRFNMEELSKQNMVIPSKYREFLISHYRDKLDVYAILSERPTIVFAVKFKLLNDSFFETPKEINEIKVFFEDFGWIFLGTSIQNTLKRMPKAILMQDHPTKENTFVYSKREPHP